jgi:hypothetical protein
VSVKYVQSLRIISGRLKIFGLQTSSRRLSDLEMYINSNLFF